MVIGIFFGTCVYTLGNRNFPRGMELGGGEGRGGITGVVGNMGIVEGY